MSCSITEVKSAPVRVGRFQVTPSVDVVDSSDPANPAPPAPQPTINSNTQSESSTEEVGGSESSLNTSLTMSPPQPHPHRDPKGVVQKVDRPAGWAVSQHQHRNREDEEIEDEEEEREILGERSRVRKRGRRRTCSLSLMGTSADSGLSVTAAEMEGRLWDGAAGSPQYSNALHNLWLTTYNRSAPYLSSDDSDREDEEMMEELQELREK